MEEFESISLDTVSGHEYVRAGLVKRSSVVQASHVDVKKVQGGSLIVAETVSGLEEVSTGSIVVCRNVDDFNEDDICSTGGKIVRSLGLALEHLEDERAEYLEDDFSTDQVDRKIEQVRSILEEHGDVGRF